MIGFKRVKNRGKVEFYTRVEATSSISEHQKNLFSHSGMTTVINI